MFEKDSNLPVKSTKFEVLYSNSKYESCARRQDNKYDDSLMNGKEYNWASLPLLLKKTQMPLLKTPCTSRGFYKMFLRFVS